MRTTFALRCWPKSDSFFGGALFFIWGHQLATFLDQSAMLEEHLSQKKTLAPPNNPKIWPKTCPGGSKNWSIFLWQFCQNTDKTCGQDIKNLTKIRKIFFFFLGLEEVKVRICVRLNCPILNLILLTAFHKFARLRGPNKHQWYLVSLKNFKAPLATARRSVKGQILE